MKCVFCKSTRSYPSDQALTDHKMKMHLTDFIEEFLERDLKMT